VAEPIYIKELPLFKGKKISLRGWLAGIRSGGKIVFLLIRDGTGFAQCTVEASREETFKKAKSLTLESSFMLEGEVVEDKRAPGGFEVLIENISIIHIADNYPLGRKAHGIDFLMEHRHLWLRSRRQMTILRIRHSLEKAIHDFFDDGGFVRIDSPILIQSAAEGAGTLFPVDYFGEKAYLSQTGQLYLECACMALGKVYCFGPTFRAEKSKTRRHLTEFWMVEPEVAFTDLTGVIELAEKMICFVVETILKKHKDDLAFLGRDIAALENIKSPFPRITYSEAIDLLHSEKTKEKLENTLLANREKLNRLINELETALKERQTSKTEWQQDRLDQKILDLREEIKELEQDVENATKHISQALSFKWGEDLGGSDETIVSQSFDKPVFITHYPRQVKAFYMKLDETDKKVVKNVDMLAPEGYGEIIGGSQREENYESLIEKMKEENLNPADYGWYLDLRKYGTVPHGGFGLGIERCLAWICGLKHVRETIPFPRLMGRIVP
jgi:asparaginyl-tRNA synthetase